MSLIPSELKVIFNNLIIKNRIFVILMPPTFFLSSLAEAVGVMSIIPLLAVITEQTSDVRIVWIIEKLEYYFPGYDIVTLLFISFIFGIFFASFARFFILIYQQRIAHNISADLAQKVFENYLHSDNGEDLAGKSSEIVSVVSNKIERMNYQVLLPIIQCISALILILVVMCLLVISFGFLPVLSLIVTGLFYVLLYVVVKNNLRKYSKIINRNLISIVEIAQEAALMFREIKIYRLKKILISNFDAVNRPLQRSMGNLRIINNGPRIIIDGTIAITFSIFILYYQKYIGSIIELVPLIVVLAIAIGRIVPMIQQVFVAYSSFSGGYECLKDVVSYLETKKLVKKNNSSQLSENSSIKQKKIISIELQNVCYSYDNNNEVLTDINLKINLGARIGILGESGSGKSTLIDILLGLKFPTKGKILVNGNYVNNLNEYQNAGIYSYVPQSVFLFNKSLKFNIALNEFPSSDSKVISLIKRLNLKDASGKLMSENVNVGELGKNVSGGQRQKIGIARALYHEGSFLFFDEVTSALDIEGEKEIVSLFGNLEDKQNACVFVTHRPALLSVCSEIFKLEKTKLLKMEK